MLRKSGRQQLLVFDNAPDRAAVETFLPPAGRGQVLVTSRSALWPPGQVLEVPVLDTEVAAAFLISRTGDADGQPAAELAAELGGLPLALEQAAAYIRASGGSLARYVASFRQRRARLLARGEPTGYSQTVATTWSLALTRLEHSAPQAGPAAAAHDWGFPRCRLHHTGLRVSPTSLPCPGPQSWRTCAAGLPGLLAGWRPTG